MRSLRLFLLSLSLVGCASSTRGADPSLDEDQATAEEFEELGTGPTSSKQPDSSVSVIYGRTAGENWKRGEAAFEDEDYQAAQKFFEYIRSKFPYSGLAVKAELRTADCLFARERYLEAIDAYTNFKRLHPTHKDAGYAAFRAGAAYHAQIPRDWFFLPSAYEKDQASVRDAARALQAYSDQFPSDAHHQEGLDLLADVRRRLVRHERMVADFYRRIDKPKAYAGRLEVIYRELGDVGIDEGLLVELVEVAHELGDNDKAAARLAELESKFPSSAELQRLRAMVRGTGS